MSKKKITKKTTKKRTKVKKVKATKKVKKTPKKRKKTYLVLYTMIWEPGKLQFKLLFDRPDQTYRVYSRMKGEKTWTYETSSKRLDVAYQLLTKLMRLSTTEEEKTV